MGVLVGVEVGRRVGVFVGRGVIVLVGVKVAVGGCGVMVAVGGTGVRVSDGVASGVVVKGPHPTINDKTKDKPMIDR
jgi:hypothetical protein